MSKVGIYKITQTDTGRVYVGSSINIEKRWVQHIADLRRNKHSNDNLQKDVIKFGIKSLVFEIIEITDESLLKNREQYWITTLNSYYSTYPVIRNRVSDSTLENLVRVWQKSDSIDDVCHQVELSRGAINIWVTRLRKSGVPLKYMRKNYHRFGADKIERLKKIVEGGGK